MLLRLIFHISLLSLLSALGVWLIHQDLLPAQQGGFSKLDGLAAAMYWFALLVYALFGSLAYLVLRRRSFQSLMIAHLFSAGIGTLGAVGIVILGQMHVDEVRFSNASPTTDETGIHGPSTGQTIDESGESSPTVPPEIPK
jgi:hypothetical protein